MNTDTPMNEIMNMDVLIETMKKIVNETVKRNQKDFSYDIHWLRKQETFDNHVFFIWIVREGGTHVKEFEISGYKKGFFLKDIPNTGTEKFFYVDSYGSMNTIRELTRGEAERKINAFVDFLNI